MHDHHSEEQPLGRPVIGWKPCSVPSRQTIVGSYCRLEALDAKRHAQDLYRSNQLDRKGSQWTYLGYGPFPSEKEFEQWVELQSQCSDPLFFSILLSSSNQAAGVASYLRISPGNGCIEIGHLNFSPLLQRTQAATEAIFLLMSRAFDLGYRRLEWKCNSLNAPSRSAALRLGFTYEGTFRNADIVKGRNRDTSWYSIIDSEWPSIKEILQSWLDPSNFDEKGRQRTRLSVMSRQQT